MSWVSVSVSAVWIAVFWVMSRDRTDTWVITMIGMVASLIAVGLAAANIWDQVLTLYPGDSFWTLGWGGRIGVLAISGIGITLTFTALSLKTRIVLALKTQANATAWLSFDLALGLSLFAVVFSVSPQVFYTFYRMIFADLPQQWVIDGLINVERLGEVVVLQPNGAMADHLAGLTFWAIALFTLWLHRRHWWRGT